MNYKTTEKLIEAIKPYINSYELEDLADRNGKIDHIIIDKKHDFSFQVYANEVIVFYFTDHCHFEDYTSELEVGADDYIKRAEDFLLKLVTLKIRHIDTYKRKKHISDKYYLVYPDGREDEYIGGVYHGIIPLLNPFVRKPAISTAETVWHYSKDKSTFITRCKKSPNADAIEVIDINEDCYIEIHKKHNAYTFSIMKIDYDEEHGIYYWAPGSTPSGLYDTKERATQDAMRNI